MASQAKITNRFDSLRLEYSESEEEVPVEAGEESDSDVSVEVGRNSDSEEDFAIGAGLDALKETVWRQKITSCPEYEIIANLVPEDDKSASVEETINAIVEITKDCLQKWVDGEKRPTAETTVRLLEKMEHDISRHVAVTWSSVMELANATPREWQGKLLEFTLQLEKTNVKGPGSKHDKHLTHQRERVWTSGSASAIAPVYRELEETTEEPENHKRRSSKRDLYLALSPEQAERNGNLISFGAQYIDATARKQSFDSRLLWAIHAHIAPAVRPFYTPLWKNKGRAKIPEPLVQAACLRLNYAGDKLWEWAVKKDDWERRNGIHPDETKEREIGCLTIHNYKEWFKVLDKLLKSQGRGNVWMYRNKRLSDANEALLAETLTRMHRAIKTGPQPDKTIEWETAYKERMEFIDSYRVNKSDQDSDAYYSSSYDPEEDLDPVSPNFNRHAFEQRHFSGPAHEKGRVKGRIRK
ncbi:hypothetical protein QBC37DRAFT_403166 [Rhypophila decipiens]|uniref:Uncharacterized protein n=1 Tax=Rhypophila decipiens TaxID=261697 RepID=A0AAN7B560_9PEZI|nr:hypothetical protein QBC37DRAFT_403166 [Rhypophila decipiens]